MVLLARQLTGEASRFIIWGPAFGPLGAYTMPIPTALYISRAKANHVIVKAYYYTLILTNLAQLYVKGKVY